MRSTTLAVFIAFCLTACGGGGTGSGGFTSPPRTNPPSTGTVAWTANSYRPAAEFKDRCQSPRFGVDSEGNPFPDVSGSTAIENFWLRSWTHETYLWNDEVLDRNPNLYDDRLEYFDLMVTNAITSSGAFKDNFHFSQPTAEYLEQRNSTPTASYGVSFEFGSTTPPRSLRVRYTDPNTPASEIVGGQPQFVRGARIIRVDGIDLANSSNVDGLNAGLFPETAGETHTFEVQDPGSSTTRTVTITAANLARKPVNRVEIINTGADQVGYILFNTFSPYASEIEIIDAMTQLQTAGVSDVVLDLRYNGGGLLAIASQLGYMLAGDATTSGATFERLRFNADAGGVNPVTGETDNSIPFYSTGIGFSAPSGSALPALDLNRVFILSTDSTCSASEAVINGLRGVDVEVILIGGRTCGKPYGFYPTDNCGETYYTIQFQGVNNKSFGDYADGFVPSNATSAFGVRLPGCQVADDFNTELGDASEGMLAAALQYRATGMCPAPSSVTLSKPAQQADGALAIKRPSPLFDSNRDMTMPEDRP